MSEEALLFGKTKSLVGIVTNPPETKKGHHLPAILLLNSGLIHRVGLNRLHVKMARALAEMGFLVFRFDFSGIGDSKVRDDHLPAVKSTVSETQEAVDYLSAARGTERFVLMGICSGAKASFKTACCDPRVVGAVLINARNHLHDDTNDELSSFIRDRTLVRHYWRIAFSSSFSAKNWLKAIAGKVDYQSVFKEMIGFPIKSLFRRKKKEAAGANDVAVDLRLLKERGVRLLHVYSEADEGLDYLYMILGDKMRDLNASGLLRLEIIQGANHTFTLLWSQEHLLRIVCNWAQVMLQG
jgi:dienelactone hydrolase